MINLSYWSFIGTIYLILLTYKDIKGRGFVDGRLNYTMLGVTLSLIFIIRRKTWVILLSILLIFIFFHYSRKLKALGTADLTTLSWIFYGFSIINIAYLLWFFVIFAIFTGLYLALRKFLLKVNKATPFYPVILCSFFLTCFLFGLY